VNAANPEGGVGYPLHTRRREKTLLAKRKEGQKRSNSPAVDCLEEAWGSRRCRGENIAQRIGQIR